MGRKPKNRKSMGDTILVNLNEELTKEAFDYLNNHKGGYNAAIREALNYRASNEVMHINEINMFLKGILTALKYTNGINNINLDQITSNVINEINNDMNNELNNIEKDNDINKNEKIYEEELINKVATGRTFKNNNSEIKDETQKTSKITISKDSGEDSDKDEKNVDILDYKINTNTGLEDF